MKLYYVNTLDAMYAFGPFIDYAAAKAWADYVQIASYKIADKSEHTQVHAPYVPFSVLKDAGKAYG